MAATLAARSIVKTVNVSKLFCVRVYYFLLFESLRYFCGITISIFLTIICQPKGLSNKIRSSVEWEKTFAYDKVNMSPYSWAIDRLQRVVYVSFYYFSALLLCLYFCAINGQTDVYTSCCSESNIFKNVCSSEDNRG